MRRPRLTDGPREDTFTRAACFFGVPFLSNKTFTHDPHTIMPAANSRMPLPIEWGDCDPAGIVFNPHFFEYFDMSTWRLVESVLGVAKQNLSAHFGIFSIPLVDARAEFKIPLKFGDRAEIESSIGEMRRSSFDVHHRIYKDGAIAVEGRETRVWTGYDPNNPERLRALPMPDDVVARLMTAKA